MRRSSMIGNEEQCSDDGDSYEDDDNDDVDNDDY